MLNRENGILKLFSGKTLLVVLGPTASGKTELAVKIAQWLSTEIISADSRQFYHELSIGTAKPSAEQLAAVPHHFIGHISVQQHYNISQFEQDTLKLLHELFLNHDIVIMCGGSGLYIDAVCHGIDEQPAHHPVIRKSLVSEYMVKGIEYLQEELLRLDPVYYRQVDLSNPNRMIRALEVCLMTGKPYSSFRSGQLKKREFRIVKLGMDVSREELRRRIDQRVDFMMDHGLLGEVMTNACFRHLNALNTVGYKELFEYLDGRMTLDEATEKIRINTRRYAKRQMTWFRKDQEIQWIQPGSFTPVILDKTLDR
jgi:tRNA dimethylallyltransferase